MCMYVCARSCMYLIIVVNTETLKVINSWHKINLMRFHSFTQKLFLSPYYGLSSKFYLKYPIVRNIHFENVFGSSRGIL